MPVFPVVLIVLVFSILIVDTVITARIRKTGGRRARGAKES